MSEGEVDGLFDLPPEEFTAARNALARRLKDEGNASAADEVKQLTKPSIAVWAINQLARNHKTSVKLLLESAARLRKAQENALKSGGSGDALRRAQADERKALRELTEHAQRILEDAGRPAGTTVLDKVSSTLRAAAVDESGREAVKAGRLTGELKPSGFDVFAGLELPAKGQGKKAPPVTHDEVSERRRRKAELESKRRELEKRAGELATRADEDAETAEQAEDEARRARKAADKSRREADAAADELEKLGT